jgi:DNA repair ATPase RecN
VTSVARLDEETRVAEIARMMGGADAGAQAQASARELLAAARAKGESPARRKRK